MQDSIKLFVVTDMTKPPLQLAREGTTYSHVIGNPVPMQIIVFAIGDWSLYSPDTLFSVTLHSHSSCHSLGAVTNVQRCLYWEKQKYIRRTELDLLPKSEAKLSLIVSLVGEQATNQVPPFDVAVGDGSELVLNLYLRENAASTQSSCKSDIPKNKRKSYLGLASPSVIQRPKCKNTEKFNDENADKENYVVNKIKKDVFVTTDPLPKRVEKCVAAACKEVSCKDRPMPSSRWGHSMTCLTDHLAILIGGQGDKRQLRRDAIWLLNTETRKWRAIKVPAEGQRPDLRLGHTATHDPVMRCIYVYGGSKSTKWFHDVHMLDIDQWTWHVLKTNDKAPIRAYHSATLFQHELLVFGGIYPVPDPQPDKCSNDVYIFSPITRSWYQPDVKGNKPLPRSGHSATRFENKLIIFGGWDFPVCYSELFILDSDAMKWNQPEVVGSPPKPRSWHGAAALSSYRLLIHGGYDGNVALNDSHILNMTTLTWTEIKVNNSPEPRAGHSIISLPYSCDKGKNDEVIVFGGGDNDDTYFKDVLSFTIPFSPNIVSRKSEHRNILGPLKTANMNLGNA